MQIYVKTTMIALASHLIHQSFISCPSFCQPANIEVEVSFATLQTVITLIINLRILFHQRNQINPPPLLPSTHPSINLQHDNRSLTWKKIHSSIIAKLVLRSEPFPEYYTYVNCF